MPEKPRVRVLLPRSLQMYWGAAGTADVAGETLADALAQLGARWPGLAERILDDQGRVRRHVLVFVNDTSVGHLEPEAVDLREGDVVRMLPAVSGG